MLLATERLREHFRYADEDVHAIIAELATIADVTGEITDLPSVVRDPNDDMIIACAITAEASYLVTRDKDLLTLGTHKTITILNPEAFIALLRASS